MSTVLLEKLIIRSASQEMPRLLFNLNVNYRVRKISLWSLSPILNVQSYSERSILISFSYLRQDLLSFLANNSNRTHGHFQCWSQWWFFFRWFHFRETKRQKCKVCHYKKLWLNVFGNRWLMILFISERQKLTRTCSTLYKEKVRKS